MCLYLTGAKSSPRLQSRVPQEQTYRDLGRQCVPWRKVEKCCTSPGTEALCELCRMVWTRCADRILGSLAPILPPSLKAWLQLKLLTTCGNETLFLRRKRTLTLSEICLLWNFMTHFVSCNHFLSEDGSGLLWSLAYTTFYHPFIGCVHQGCFDSSPPPLVLKS